VEWRGKIRKLIKNGGKTPKTPNDGKGGKNPKHSPDNLASPKPANKNKIFGQPGSLASLYTPNHVHHAM
jgi:hypothetical protein